MSEYMRAQYPALIAGFLIAVTLFLFGVWYGETRKETVSLAEPLHTIAVGENQVVVTLADTPEERTQGLSGREVLNNGEGMLFVFPEEGNYSFWMKDMNFSIDILWLSSEGKIVHIVEHVSPESYPDHFVSERPARYVLEVPAGYVESRGVSVGDIVRL